MEIVVQLHTILQITSANGLIRKINYQLDANATVSDLITRLNLSLSPNEILIVINGQVVEMYTVIHDGDIIHLIPAISGGRINKIWP